MILNGYEINEFQVNGETYRTIPKAPNHAININGEVIRKKARKNGIKADYWVPQKLQINGRPRENNCRDGYLGFAYAADCIKGKQLLRRYDLHRALMLSWVPCEGDTNEYIIKHKDGAKYNNDITNLIWVKKMKITLQQALEKQAPIRHWFNQGILITKITPIEGNSGLCDIHFLFTDPAIPNKPNQTFRSLPTKEFDNY